MERLGDEVRRSLRSAGVSDAGALAAVVRAWPAAVGDAIARAAWPARIGRDGTLHVATVSSTWAFELDRLAPEIREQLMAAIGSETPSALRFAPGPVPAPGAVQELVQGGVAEPSAAPRPGPEEERRAAALATPIEDPELREMVRRAAAASLAGRSSGRSFW